jgi:hypothetical protein
LDNWQYKKYFDKEQIEQISRENVLPLPTIDREIVAALDTIKIKVTTYKAVSLLSFSLNNNQPFVFPFSFN